MSEKGLMRLAPVRWFVHHSVSEHHRWSQMIDGITVAEYRPLIEWTIGFGIVEIGFRERFAVGVLYWRRFGNWSRIKKKFRVMGRWTFYVNLGECAPYDPLTGRAW